MVSTVGGFFIAMLILASAAAIGWVGYTQIRARKLGLPPPSLSSYNPFQSSSLDPYSPDSHGPAGWVKQRISAFRNRNKRSAVGAYEGARHDDEAWDAHADAYGYEAELEDGRFQQNTHYQVQSTSYNMNTSSTPAATRATLDPDADEPRGRSRSRGPSAEHSRSNPFGDDAQPSNMSTHSLGPYGQAPQDHHTPAQSHTPRPTNSSPERRSIFREEV
ncbi:hypothetical protein BROUX41_004339 [Berkeleyomyces rouxiae]|uniref:uncharacterized protein n=1 Tax=Berkeleyomyces rouxiae TaxID=2035830 RepID=UPI003B7D50B1